MIITVDGPAAAGKGTIARSLAEHYGYHFLDTGSLYRRVGLALQKSGADENDVAVAAGLAAQLDAHPVDQAELRSETTARLASRVAVMPEVRSALLDYQRQFAAQKPGAVLDGRDTGTVVCPEAEMKLFITASAEVRAQRRYHELKTARPGLDLSSVLKEIVERDERDRTRAVAPLLPAIDAVIVDTSALAVAEAIARVIAIVDDRRARLSKL